MRINGSKKNQKVSLSLSLSQTIKLHNIPQLGPTYCPGTNHGMFLARSKTTNNILCSKKNQLMFPKDASD